MLLCYEIRIIDLDLDVGGKRDGVGLGIGVDACVPSCIIWKGSEPQRYKIFV